jgi:hypothetical protein
LVPNLRPPVIRPSIEWQITLVGFGHSVQIGIAMTLAEQHRAQSHAPSQCAAPPPNMSTKSEPVIEKTGSSPPLRRREPVKDLARLCQADQITKSG